MGKVCVKTHVMLVLYNSVDRPLRHVRGYVGDPWHYIELIQRSLQKQSAAAAATVVFKAWPSFDKIVDSPYSTLNTHNFRELS